VNKMQAILPSSLRDGGAVSMLFRAKDAADLPFDVVDIDAPF
jgi:hypothetical protein